MHDFSPILIAVRSFWKSNAVTEACDRSYFSQAVLGDRTHICTNSAAKLLPNISPCVIKKEKRWKTVF